MSNLFFYPYLLSAKGGSVKHYCISKYLNFSGSLRNRKKARGGTKATTSCTTVFAFLVRVDEDAAHTRTARIIRH